MNERFLARELPKEISGAGFVEIVDTYIPDGPGHAELRLRKKGDKYEEIEGKLEEFEYKRIVIS